MYTQNVKMIWIFLAFVITCSLTSSYTNLRLLKYRVLCGASPSYENMLERANAMKQLKLAQPVTEYTKPSTTQTSKKSWTPLQSQPSPEKVRDEVPSASVPWTGSKSPEQMSAREKASFKSKIPFSEEIYDVLKTTIELLSTRINEPETKLTVEESQWLLQAVDVIIEDAKRFGPPPKPESVATDASK